MGRLKPMRALYLAIIGVLLLMFAAACGGAGPDEDAPIQIGFSGELSGGAAEGGENILQGVELATEVINEEGGIHGRTVEIVTRDTEMNPSRGVSIIRDFAQQDVLGLVGGYLSTVMLAQAPIIATEEIPFMVATSNVPASVEEGLPWTFGVRMNAPVTARYALDFLERNYNTNQVAILHESGGYGEGAADAMTQALEEIGEEPVAVESFNLDDTDMTAQVTRARDAGAEAVYLFGIGASNGYVLRDMARIGWEEVPVVGEMGMIQTVVPEIAGEAANGAHVIQTANYAGEQERDMAEKLVTKAEEKYGAPPSMGAPSAQGFDATMLLANAIESVELTGDVREDREAIRQALETEIGLYEGVIKDYDPAFTTDDHDAIGVEDYLMTVWQDGVLVRAEEQ